MNELEIMKKLHEILPDSWHISEIVEESGLVKITCPINERYGGDKMDSTIAMIEKAIDADYDGGGATIGGVSYDNYFYVHKPKKAKKTNKKANKKTVTKKKKEAEPNPGIQRDMLLWIPERKEFFKIQPGIGDNLSPGCEDYFLFSAFRPVTLGVDQELEMKDLGGGQLDIEEGNPPTEKVVGDAIEEHYGKRMKYVVLMTSDDINE